MISIKYNRHYTEQININKCLQFDIQADRLCVTQQRIQEHEHKANTNAKCGQHIYAHNALLNIRPCIIYEQNAKQEKIRMSICGQQ